MTTPSPAAPMTPDVVAPHRWRALAALVVSLLVVVLDNTVLNVALKTIQDDLGATQSELIWAINSYSLVFAALLFTWGVLGDRYGRRKILIIGLVLFAAASLLSAFAQTPMQLIIARGLMGIGGASVLPVTLSIITVIFPPAERGKAIGIWAAAVGGAVALGPAARRVPARALLVGLGVPDQHPDHRRRDRAGSWPTSPSRATRTPDGSTPSAWCCRSIGLLALVYGIQEAGWSEPVTYAWIAFGVAVLAGFLFWESRTDHPSMDLSLFSIRSFSVPLAATSLTFAALSGSLIFLAFYYQVVRGWSPLQSGALTVPFAIGQLLSAPRSGKMVARFGARRVIPFGLVLASTAMFMFTRLDLTTPVWLLILIPFVFGFGMGNVVAPSTTRMTLATPPQRSGSGSAVQNTVRQVGATLGVAIISSVVASKYSGAMSSALEGSPLPADLQATASDSVGATYEVASTAPGLGAGDRCAGRRAALGRGCRVPPGLPHRRLHGPRAAAHRPGDHPDLAAGAGRGRRVEGGRHLGARPGAARRGAPARRQDAYAVGSDLDAAHQVHVVAEDPEHLSHVEDAPLEHPLGESAPDRG